MHSQQYFFCKRQRPRQAVGPSSKSEVAGGSRRRKWNSVPRSAPRLRFPRNAYSCRYVGTSSSATQQVFNQTRKISRSHSRWLESIRPRTSQVSIRKFKHRAPSRRRRQYRAQVHTAQQLVRSVSVRHPQFRRCNRIRNKSIPYTLF